MQIIELKTTNDILAAYPIMGQLRTSLDQETYLNLVKEAIEYDQYRMFALYVDDKMIAVIGFKIMITLYYGKFVWVCDLVTDSEFRSQGYGEKLLTFVENWAKGHQIQTIALSSGLQRVDAHRFYEDKMEYDKVSFVFKKTI